jgi:hypothetical protein
MADFDDLRLYGSGAASDGAAQPDPDANLGGYRSASEIQSLAVLGAMENVTIDRVADGYDPGAAGLESDGAGYLRWSGPGSSPGPWVAVGDGETKVLPDGSDSALGVRVTRSGAVPPQGTALIKLLEQYNGALGMPNISDAQRTAGRTIYRCLFLRNVSAVDIQRVVVRPEGENVQVAVETPVDGAVQTIADETTAPVGLTFYDVSGSVRVAPLGAGGAVAIWLKRITNAGAAATARKVAGVILEVE